MSKRKRLNMQKRCKCAICGTEADSMPLVHISQLDDMSHLGDLAQAGDLDALARLYFGAMFGPLEELTDDLAAELIGQGDGVTQELFDLMRQEDMLYSRARNSFVERGYQVG